MEVRWGGRGNAFDKKPICESNCRHTSTIPGFPGFRRRNASPKTIPHCSQTLKRQKVVAMAAHVIFLIRDIDGPKGSGAPVESCHLVVLRSPRARLGSVLDVHKRLRRMHGGFHRWIAMRTGAQLPRGLHHDPPKFWIQSSLERPKHYRMRCTRLSHPRPIPEGVRGPICIRKK